MELVSRAVLTPEEAIEQASSVLQGAEACSSGSAIFINKLTDTLTKEVEANNIATAACDGTVNVTKKL